MKFHDLITFDAMQRTLRRSPLAAQHLLAQLEAAAVSGI